MITIGTQVRKAAGVVKIAERYDDVFFTVGTHPHEAAGEGAEDFDAMRALAKHPKCVGVGEAGLDYHYDSAPRDVAERVFRGHIALARELDLPLVIHTRDADADMGAILAQEMGQGRFRAVLHCFTASRELAESALGLGLMISFSGVVTFKKSEDLRAIARDVPLDRLLVETDAPYLAPTPHRGRRNEPAFVVATAGVVAEARGIEPEALAAATRANTLRFFSRLEPAGGKPPQVSRVRPIELAPDDSGLRLVRRRAAGRAGVGRVRSLEPEKPSPPLLRARRTHGARRRDRGPHRHLAGLARAATGREGEAARRRAVEPSPRRSYPRHR